MATSSDIQEIISKLSSDKAKAREEGIKLLNSWLEGERSITFCKLLSRNTARLKPNEIPHVETWPFLITILMKCITLEISSSKKRLPKLSFAKTLRNVIQRAEDAKFYGKTLLLLSVVKQLFNHIWDVVRDAPNFQSEYGTILRHLLAVKEYHFHMRKRVYCSLVVWYMNKIEMSMEGTDNFQPNSREEVFRYILTLHSLLENPPGDFPDNLREDLIKGFVGIFSHVREEGKVSRKLVECINTFLLRDGPNLGSQSMKIHSSVQDFMIRFWLSTHDRGLKSSLIHYARIQLKLCRSATDGYPLIQQLLDVVGKELDQGNVAGTGIARSDTARDDKLGALANSHFRLMELAASVFYQACVNTAKEPLSEKRIRREHAADRLKDGLVKGNWLWIGAFCFLIRNYRFRISNALVNYWFQGICESFERILIDGNRMHAYDSLVWVLRSLQELSSLKPFLSSIEGSLQCPSITYNKVRGGWHLIWSCLMHALPMLSNVTPIADAALALLGNIISNDLVNVTSVPQDVWDLRLFKHMPSACALYFIACYFSRKGCQGDLREVLHLRQTLLRAVLGLFNLKESFFLNERMVMLLPAAIFSLCAGCVPLPYFSRELSVDSCIAVLDATESWTKIEDNDQELVHELLECSVEKIAEIESGSDAEVFQTQYSHGLRLPRRIRYPLVHEMEDYFRINISSDEEIQKLRLSDLFLLSALFSNCIYCSMLTRLREEKSTFLTRMLQHLLELLDRAVAVIEENHNDLQSHGSLGSGLIPDFTTALASLRFCICCPLFSMWRDKSTIHDELCMRVILVTKRLLLALTKLFEEFSKFTCNAESDLLVPEHSHSSLLRSSDISGDGKMRIVDMELDLDEEPKDIDISVVAGKNSSVICSSVVQLKLDMISAISSFFSVLPDVTWEVMFDLLGKENDATVCENILHWLCEKYSCSSTRNMSDLVRSLKNRMEVNECSKPCCVDILAAIHGLLRTLLPFSSVGKEDVSLSVREKVPEQNIVPLGDLVNQIADSCTHDWSARIKLIDCICYFVSLDPHNAQGMIERLLVMLHDVDYRVRLFLARRIGVLFQTWDGHDELFQDICSNFGVKLVISSKGKLITAQEVLAVGAQSNLILETTIVTLSHLAFVSEKVELEAIFMICAVAAIDPLQRELVYTILDNLSRELNYKTRSKYLAELIASILFCWVACGLSLVSLVEVRHLFLCESEPNSFMQYCCPWLLPALILSGSTSELDWVSMVASQPLAGLVKVHFVPIFAVCMALHCSQKSNKENGAVVLRSSILQIGEIVEHERDDLIKKNMLSIVSCLLSLSSSASDPVMPFFPTETIVIAVKKVVDGFLEMDNNSANIGVVDKIHIFRPDRVFKFLVEIHYQITSAVHSRHRCNRLSAVEVLISTIRYRALVPSTSCYIFSLVGQYIGFKALQDQCCLILSMLLEVFKINPTKNVIKVLGEQLQFLVSKLVACCIPSENNQDPAVTRSSGIISLLHQLTVDADPSLHDYIRELEPFPELDCLEKILTFHQKLCEAYSPKDHFMKFVRRTFYLPQRLILWSLQTLHKKLLMREIIQLEGNTDDVLHEFNGWNCEPEIVSAVWNLVGLCIMNDAKDIRVLVADFISRVGIGDPHGVVFHLPGNSNQRSLFQFHSIGELGIGADIAVSEEVLVKLITMLKKYLLDDSVKIVDSTSRALRGILSTERGQSALLSFESYDRSLIAIHSKGVNLDLVQKFLSASETKSSEVISLEDPSLWKTHGKTFELWICTLVYSLIDHTSDTILRLCQDMAFLKAEVAELLFPVVLMNLAGRMDMHTEVCQLISVQVQQNIFTESNDLMRSVQVMLDALNILRLCHVNERADTSSTSSKQEISKNVRTSSYSSRSRNSSASEKSKKLSMTPKTGVMSSSSWKKVYWLAIDYLLVAKAAIHCGSYFTSVMYVEHWCEEHFNCLTLGKPDFSDLEMLPPHIELLAAAVRQINEPDSIYGIIQSHKLTSQIVMFEHEGNWSKALESYDLLVRTPRMEQMDGLSDYFSRGHSQAIRQQSSVQSENGAWNWKSHKGLMRSLQQTGCTHVLDMYCHGLTTQKDLIQHDSEFTELQYEAAWRAGNWDFSLLSMAANSSCSGHFKCGHFNENLYCCLRALQEGDSDEFRMKLKDSKQELVLEISHASKESTESIYSAIIKLQILDHLGNSWDLRWKPSQERTKSCAEFQNIFPEPVIPSMTQLEWLNVDWSLILKRTQLHLNLIEPFIAFRRVLLQILNCNECTIQHLLHSASALRKGDRFSLAAAALHEFRLLCSGAERQAAASYICSLGRLEEAKLLRAQGQHEMAINLARYILDHYQLKEASSNVHRLVGKWLAETRSSNSRTILEQYLKRAVELNEANRSTEKKYIARQCQTYFHLAHYTDALFRNYEERLASSEWQAAMRLRKHKTNELEALIRRVKSSTKGEKTDCSVKIQELQKQLAMDGEEAQKLQDDRDKFLNLALEGYQHCLVIGDKYDLRAVFRLVSLWFSLSSRQNVINSMLSAVKEVESYKFVPLMYQIASRMGSSKEGQGSMNFQFALVSLLKKMAVDHPYHTIFQLLALANGDRVKDKQRSRNSFVVDMDKKLAAENLLDELSSFHGARIRQMKQLVEIYIKLAELETKKEDTRRITLPREIRNLRELELVPVVTATFPVDRSCQYHEGSFPHFKGLADSITVMNGINAPKVVECIGSDGHRYRQLAKSGNDDLRQDAVMEQFFGLVNTFLQNHRDTWKRRLSIRTYKVVPFTPSAGVLEWVDRTTPLGDYLLGSTRSGGAHRRYGNGDWAFPLCRQHMTNEKDKRKAFLEVCENFRPVMHYFFLERYLHPADWFEKRLSYTRSVAASSMVGYIVGLGDRHSMNILLDEATAEVVHIDLGVAFEQGLMLKTPERVPFRLTRDIIDGMGVTGVEGVFRRCSEETLSVMRTNKEALLTIIEVFIHDPLYKWALSPLKALQRQKEIDDDIESSLEGSQDDYEGNRDAARALMRVKQKLDGYEDGEMRSVQGQVQQLIQDAIDTDRLCHMFPGWGAWL